MTPPPADDAGSTRIPGFRGPAAATEPQEAQLRRGALGLRSVVFQNMTNMAPAAAIVYDFPAQVAAAGAALWVSNLVSLVAVLLIASSIIQFARRIPHAGGYYSYLSRALGPTAGAFSGWVYFLYALILPAEVTLVWAGIAQALCDHYLHVNISWVIFEIVMLGLVTLLAYTGVQRSARVVLIAGTAELAVFVVLAIALLVKPASPIRLSDLSPSNAIGGWSGILGFGLVYGILNFVGFESAAPMAEETDDPKRNVPRSILYSVAILGSVYMLMSFSTVFGWGIPQLGDLGTATDPYITMADRVLGIGTLLVFVAATNSSFGCALATVNQSTRVLMSMGRNGLLPQRVGSVHPTYRTPHVAALAIGVTALVIALVAGAAYGTLTGFFVLAATLTDGALLVYIAGNIGLPIYYRREAPHEFKPLVHLVLPVIAVVMLAYVVYRTFWPIPAYPLNLPGYIAIAWVVLGVVVLAAVKRARPQSLAQVVTEEIG